MAGAGKKGRSAIERKVLSGSVREWFDARGSMRIDRVSRNAIVIEPKGHLEAGFVELFEIAVDDAITDGKPHLFWDGTAMTGYDSAFRLRLGKYCVRVKHQVASMNVFTPQPMVAMGASVINIWLGGFFTMHKTRNELMETLTRVKAAPRA
ncbi:MAG: hypothetical protein ABI183_00800 [Polyangiaceae bacterium]